MSILVLDIYWLGLDENVIPNPSYPDRGRVREAFAIAVAMGANTVRAHTLGVRYVQNLAFPDLLLTCFPPFVSTGNPLSVWPSAGKTNEDAVSFLGYSI